MTLCDAYRTHGIFVRDDVSSPALLDFHQRALVAIQQFHAALDAATKISTDLKDEVRIQRQAAAIRTARAELRRTIHEAAHTLQAPISDLRAEVERSARGPIASSDPTAALLRHHQVAELRRQIENLPEGNRVNTLMSLAASGNQFVLEALDGSVRPLAGQVAVDLLRKTFIEATAQPLLKRLESAEEAEHEALNVLQQANRLVDRATKGAGLEAALNASIPSVPMTDAQKSSFISIHGPGAFREMIESGVIPSWPKADKFERHPQAATFEDLVRQVGTPEAATTWLLEKRLPENWNPPQE